jgi:hypothetical protein
MAQFQFKSPYNLLADTPKNIDLEGLLRGVDEVGTILLQGKSDFFYRCPAFAMGV